MASNTTRAGLIKPTTLEPRAVGPLNSNADRTDELLGAFLINDGATIPDAQAIDGMIVKEKSSGKMWVLQKNVGGTFDKKYIRYPYSFHGFTANVGVSNGAWNAFGLLTFGGGSFIGSDGVNASAGDIVGTRWVVPVSGVYAVRWHVVFDPNVTGCRGGSINYNATTPNIDNNTNVVVAAVPSAVTSFSVVDNCLLPAGTTVAINLFQNSGGSLNAGFQLFANLLFPV